MKKAIMLVMAFVISLQAKADEGMWLPMLLGKQVYADMVKKGLKLKPEQLYSINKSSLKDAIIIFGRGCTGEIVSDKGLIFTNHHCGYSAIADASSVEHNYLRDGFYAKSLKEEIPAKGVTAQFLVRIDDVTEEVLSQLKDLKGKERNDKFAQVAEAIAKKAGEGNGYNARVYSMFKGNQFLMYVYETFKDVRLVGTPPESIGKYGGDTDNWEWPRHTGDFAVFRVYMSPEGKPADYNANNVPFKPKHFLPISLKGFKDGDYSMIYGYPGGTNRYETSYGVKMATDKVNPLFVKFRDDRLKLMLDEMKKDAAVKIKLAGEYAGIANYWKFFDGETKQLLKFDTYGQKKATEQKFIDWAKDKPEFKDIFSSWEKIYNSWMPFATHKVAMTEGINAPGLMKLAARMKGVETAIAENKNKTDVVNAFIKARKDGMANIHLVSDQKIMAKTLMLYRQSIDLAQQPTEFFAMLESKYGSLTEESTYQKYAEFVFQNTILTHDGAVDALANATTTDLITKDPMYQYFSAFSKNYEEKVAPTEREFNTQNAELGRLYLKGILAMDTKAAEKLYPDANFSMRVSYGNVKSYKPRDGMNYDFVCTMKGIMEKYKPGDYEFDLPKRFVDLYNRKEFGQYADKKTGDIVVGFITTNDITGGNSGSPVINGKGELIGLAFDGNYEALSHKLVFDKDLNRTICVDIRYVLWCMDVYGGAKNLIDELKIVK